MSSLLPPAVRDDVRANAPPPAPPSGARPRRSIGDEIYEILLSRLIALKIAPGARVTVDQLARELGTSQTPIRAALIRLEAEGLIVKTHLIGYSAAPLPSPQRFAEMFQIRLLLEPFAAEQATRRLTSPQREELRQVARAMVESDDDARLAYGKFAHWDARLHRLIAHAGGGDVMAETLDRLHVHMHLFRVRFHASVTEEAIKEHAVVLDAMTAGDAAGARAAMESHVERSYQRIAPVLASLHATDSPAREFIARHDPG